MKRKYSGKDSRAFWKRVNALSWAKNGQTAYMLGCVLQDVEERVLRYLEEAEKEHPLFRGKGKSG